MSYYKIFFPPQNLNNRIYKTRLRKFHFLIIELCKRKIVFFTNVFFEISYGNGYGLHGMNIQTYRLTDRRTHRRTDEQPEKWTDKKWKPKGKYRDVINCDYSWLSDCG